MGSCIALNGLVHRGMKVGAGDDGDGGATTRTKVKEAVRRRIKGARFHAAVPLDLLEGGWRSYAGSAVNYTGSKALWCKVRDGACLVPIASCLEQQEWTSVVSGGKEGVIWIERSKQEINREWERVIT